MKIDGRTKAGKEQQVIEQVRRHGGFSIFWITDHQARACAAERLIKNGRLYPSMSEKSEYPWCAWHLDS